MKPLSTATYLRNNKRKVLPGLISMIFSVFLVYFFSILLYSTTNAIKLSTMNLVERATLVSSNTKEPISESIIEKLRSNENCGDIIPIISSAGSFKYNSAFGGMTVDSYNIYPQYEEKLLDIFELKLVEGKLPSPDSKEIAVPLKYAKQNKLKVGDYIGKDPELNAFFNKKYKISGILDGPVITGFTAEPNEAADPDRTHLYSLVYSLKDRNNRAINDELVNAAGKNIKVIDYETTKNEMEPIGKSMNSLAYILDFIIIIVLGISLSNLNYIVFLNRRNEFAVMTAIGYKKSTLYKKLLKENLTLYSVGFAAGILFTIVVVELLNVAVWMPNGQYVSSIEPAHMATAFIVPVVVAFINMISPLRELKSMTYECLSI